MENAKSRTALVNSLMFRIYPSYLKIKLVGIIIIMQLNKRKSDSHPDTKMSPYSIKAFGKSIF